MRRGARFSSCRRYRYVLWRRWLARAPVCAFIGLNPSTADECYDDATIRRCIGFAQRWGFGGMYMLNLFAYRATEPRLLEAHVDPLGGGEQDRVLLRYCQRAERVVACWGIHGRHQQRDREVLRLLAKREIDVVCFGVTKEGHPRHPLYLASSSVLTPFV